MKVLVSLAKTGDLEFSFVILTSWIGGLCGTRDNLCHFKFTFLDLDGRLLFHLGSRLSFCL